MLFILSCLATLMVAFLIMIAVQVIGLEKKVKDIIGITEYKVRKLYGKE